MYQKYLFYKYNAGRYNKRTDYCSKGEINMIDEITADTACPANGKDGLLMSQGEVFREGIRDGMPIALGYLVVSFTLGIAARNAGLTPFQGFLASFFNNASAGEYAGFTSLQAQHIGRLLWSH